MFPETTKNPIASTAARRRFIITNDSHVFPARNRARQRAIYTWHGFPLVSTPHDRRRRT